MASEENKPIEKTDGDEKEMSWEEKFTTKRLEELIEDVGNAVPGTIPCVTSGSLSWRYNGQPVNIAGLSKYRTVTIDAAENGFVVIIGCKTFVETSWENVSEKLLEYWIDPVAAEKKYCK